MDIEARQSIEALKADLAQARLENTLRRLDIARASPSYAEFDPQGEQGYGKVMGPAGFVLISLEKIEPYLDGFNVYFKIGNPTSANLISVTGEVMWGKEDERFESLSQKKFSSLQTFPPGSWKVLKVAIGPADPKSIRRLVLQPKFSQLSLMVLN